MNGFLNLNKPFGITSHDAVARVRRLVGRGVKVGHGGTLDPAATGVLPLALGQATRLVEYFAEARKGYRAIVRLGATTTTDDAEGEVVAERPVPPLNPKLLEQVLDQFRGPIMQVPPMYSALHHGGKRLYDLARAGQTVERAPRAVTIYRLALGDWGLGIGDWGLGSGDSGIRTAEMDRDNDIGTSGSGVSHSPLPHPQSLIPGVSHSPLPHPQSLITLDIECSKGTYIRALARDLGEVLGCGAHLAALERTSVGALMLADAVDLAALETDGSLLAQHLLPLETAVADWPALQLDEQQAGFVRNGHALALPAQEGERLRAHAPDGTLLALLKAEGDMWKPEKVFVFNDRR